MHKLREVVYRMALGLFIRAALWLMPETEYEGSGIMGFASYHGRRLQVNLEIVGFDREDETWTSPR